MTVNPAKPPVSAVVLASGGLDSITLVCYRRDQGATVRMLSFDYGQLRRRRELESARLVTGDLRLGHDVIDLRSVGTLLAGSALTDPAIPGHPGGRARARCRTLAGAAGMTALTLRVKSPPHCNRERGALQGALRHVQTVCLI